MRGTRKLAHAIAAAVGVAALISAPAGAGAGLVIDLRPTQINGVPIDVPHNGDGPEYIMPLPANPGTTVWLNVYARVRGTNGLDDEGFQSIQGVFRTPTGGLLADLASGVVAPFNALGSQHGAQIDVDSDGDFDIGPIPNGGTPSSAFWFPRSAAMERDGVRVDENAEEWLIGTLTWTLKNSPGWPDFFIDFIRRRNPGDPGSNSPAYATWNEDGSGTASVRNGLSPYTVDGVAFPEPGGATLASLAAIGLLARRRRGADRAARRQPGPAGP
jgi:hypothetical protein